MNSQIEKISEGAKNQPITSSFSEFIVVEREWYLITDEIIESVMIYDTPKIVSRW